MKFKVQIALVTMVLSSVAFAQEEERDFGDLVPEPHFTITQKKTTLKDNADISNYEIKVSPQKDEFTYKVNSVRTPRGVIKKNDFKLSVERADGKITRITSVDFASAQDNTGAQGLQTIALGTDGKVDSLSNCFQEYGFGWFNMKADKGDLKCVTLNREICSYFEDNKIDEALVDQINNCSDLLGKLSEHQSRLEELSRTDHASNMKAIGLKKGGILGLFKKGPKNFYSVPPKTLEDIGKIAQGYGRAVSQCQYLKDKNYLREKLPQPEVKVEGDGAEGGASQQ